MARKKYQVIGVGGTFDHFHAGHRAFLLFAADLAEELIIGVTNEKLAQHKSYTNSIENYWQRSQAVKRFCGQHHIPYRVVMLNDPIGPTLEKSSVQALAATNESLPGASKINELRTNLGLRELPIHLCPMTLDELGREIHAHFIRAGEINRLGQSYRQFLYSIADQPLTKTQREFFSQPQGEVTTIDQTDELSHQGKSLTIVVGDQSLATFIDRNWHYHLGVYDHRQQRVARPLPQLTALTPTATSVNPPGLIAQSTITALEQLITKPTKNKKPQHLLVEGEEDLAAVAAILLAPLGSYVWYGQPNQGIIRVVVTEQLKETVRHALE